MKKYLLPIIVGGSALLIGVLGFILVQGKTGGLKGMGLGKGTGAVSPDILFFTQPVTNLSGKVEKVSGNSIWVSTQYTLSNFGAPAAVPQAGAAGQVMPTPVVKNITFKVNVTSTTSINRPPANIPYLLKNQNAGLPVQKETAATVPTQPPLITVKDIKSGQFISVTTSTDLRQAISYDVFATSIQLPPMVNSLNGKITKISNSSFTMSGILPTNGSFGPVAGTVAPPKTEEFVVSVTQDTEISRYSPITQVKEGELPKPPQAEKLSLSDLKEDMAVTVYTDVDITENKKFTALRIDPQIMAAPVVPQTIVPQTSPVVLPTVVVPTAVPPTVTKTVTPTATSNSTVE